MNCLPFLNELSFISIIAFMWLSCFLVVSLCGRVGELFFNSLSVFKCGCDVMWLCCYVVVSSYVVSSEVLSSDELTNHPLEGVVPCVDT